jgi:hypothetical protein
LARAGSDIRLIERSMRVLRAQGFACIEKQKNKKNTTILRAAWD